MKIVVDTNIVFSAILNSDSKIGRILLSSASDFQFYTCNFLRIEIQKHKKKLLKITNLDEDLLKELEDLVTRNITFIDERLVPQNIQHKTEMLMQSIDPDDAVFVALAKYLDAVLWTGDLKLYNGLKAKKYKGIILTSQLSVLFDEL